MRNHSTYKPTLALVSLLLFISSAFSLSPPGTIERTTKQQVLASIPPNHEPNPTGSSQLFLTSPSGKYAVFLLRRETSIGAGGFGSDFCYIQVQDSGVSAWESECTAVSNVNTCSLVFSDAGFEIFDGSRSAWDTDVEDDDAHIESLVLLDSGDMQIRDKEGELKWKASDSPAVSQNCGSIGAPELWPAHPPFASPIHGTKGPFGQDVSNQGQVSPLGAPLPQYQGQVSPLAAPVSQEQEQNQGQLSPLTSGFPQQEEQEHNLNQPFSSLNDQPFGVGNHHQQPLVDNTPFDSGSSKVVEMGLVCLLGLMGCFGFLL